MTTYAVLAWIFALGVPLWLLVEALDVWFARRAAEGVSKTGEVPHAAAPRRPAPASLRRDARTLTTV
ncbi:MAG TPA: hypothetical protein VFX28_12155 [Methylomirabilota bacterium]|nr:hypothetical protein [Methylomirabilota bacterium]